MKNDLPPTWKSQIFVDEKQVIKFAWPYSDTLWDRLWVVNNAELSYGLEVCMDFTGLFVLIDNRHLHDAYGGVM